ncbi:hypothetical protein [Cyclobacterium sediminis]
MVVGVPVYLDAYFSSEDGYEQDGAGGGQEGEVDVDFEDIGEECFYSSPGE